MRLRDPNSINANIYLPWRKVGPISQLGLPQLFNSVTKQKGQCQEFFDPFFIIKMSVWAPYMYCKQAKRKKVRKTERSKISWHCPFCFVTLLNNCGKPWEGKKLFKFKMQTLFVSGIGNSRIKKNHIFKLKCIFSCVKVSKAFAAARLWVKRLDLSTIEVHYSQEIREWYSHNRAPPNPPIQQTSWWGFSVLGITGMAGVRGMYIERAPTVRVIYLLLKSEVYWTCPFRWHDASFHIRTSPCKLC